MGVEVPRHVDARHLQLGGDLLLRQPGLVPQLTEVRADTIILLDFLIHAHPPPCRLCGNPHI